MHNPLQLSLVNYKKGAYIIVEGKQKADFFYIIRQGNVRISKEVEIVNEVKSVLDPGDFFGVVSTMSSHSHIETAQAITDVSLISVHREQFHLLIERNAPVAMKIISQFSKKMRYLDEALTRITLKSVAEEGNISHLFKVAEYYAKQSQYNQAYYAYFQYLKYAPNGEYASTAKERMAKIQPYAKAVYLQGTADDFTRSYPKDTMIFSESQPGQEMYIIQKGSVKITKIMDDNEVMLALLKPGDMFGEMSLLENKPRSASAIAHEDSVLMAVNQSNFKRMVTSQPQMITKLTQILSDRIWFIYKQLALTLINDPVGRMYEALYVILEKNRIPIRNDAYTFDIGPKELMTMVGLGKGEGNQAINKLFQNSKLKIVDNKIHCSNLEDIQKQSEYYVKMEKISKAREQGRLKNF